MPLRLIEVTVSGEGMDELCGALEETRVVDLWTTGGKGGRAAVHVLVPADGVEAVSDTLTRLFGDQEDFRLVVLDVEATLPKAEEVEKETEGEPVKEESHPDRVSREELYQDLEASSRVTPVYLATVALSTLVAAVGLLRDDVAVIIGAMVIAPLLGPNMALALSATLGDVELAWRSLKANAAGVAVALALSVAMGLVVAVSPEMPQLHSRAEVSPADVLLALAAGSAGSLAFTSGLPTAVIGVMVAVALLPPLVATGLLVGAGHLGAALGTLILLVTNITCVNLAGVATFLLRRVRPRTWWEAEKARRATKLAMGSWLVMLAILLAVILWRW